MGDAFHQGHTDDSVYGAGKENEVCGGRDMIKEILKGVWRFCSYLFWPRWGNRRLRSDGRRQREDG